MGIISELMKQGVKLLIVDVQKDFIHDSDYIFVRETCLYSPSNDRLATVISCEESREFLSSIGIHGEIIYTPSHSKDSVSLVLDNGDCFVGDLEPFDDIDAYKENVQLKSDWEYILSFHPRKGVLRPYP